MDGHMSVLQRLLETGGKAFSAKLAQALDNIKVYHSTSTSTSPYTHHSSIYSHQIPAPNLPTRPSPRSPHRLRSLGRCGVTSRRTPHTILKDAFEGKLHLPLSHSPPVEYYIQITHLFPQNHSPLSSTLSISTSRILHPPLPLHPSLPLQAGICETDRF